MRILSQTPQEKYFYFFSAITAVLTAIFIVWQPLYFAVFLLALLFLLMIFWKTEESLLALIFYLPFQIALNISNSIDLASGRLFIIILFLAWLIKSLAKKRLFVAYNPVTWLLAAFLGIAALSAYFSIDQDRSAIRLLFFFSIMPLYFIAADFLNSMPKILKALNVLIISAIGAAAIGLAQFISQFIVGIEAVMDFWAKNMAYVFYGQSFGKAILANPSWLVNIGGATVFRAISFFPDPHMLAFYLGFVSPIALSMFLFSSCFSFSFEKKLLLLSTNLILFSVLGLTFSRAGYIGAFTGVIMVVILGWRYFDKRIKFLIVSAIIAAAIMFYSSSQNAGSLIVSRFISSFNPSEGSNSERMINWRQAIGVIDKYPVLGAGIGSYAAAINIRAPERSSISAHNTYLDIAAETGVPALLVWLLLLFFAINNLCAVLKSKKGEITKEKVLAIGFVGSFVWFMVQMFFDTAIYSPVLLALLMVYLAVAVNLRKIQANVK